eukprot:XP_800240.3 PREDICTED: myb-like protein X [Strongylocentrotus purpuratus]
MCVLRTPSTDRIYLSFSVSLSLCPARIKVSATSTGKRGECLLIQLKQVVECRAAVTSKKRNSFLIQKTPNAGANRQIIFGCVNPADRDRWVHVINDVMNGTISGQSAFDEVVVSSSALTHLVKGRPKNPGRRPPGHRARALISSANSEISSFGDDATSGVGASSELLATHSTVHKLDGELVDDVIEQSPTSEECADRAVSNECLADVEEEESTKPKNDKVSSLQRLKKPKKTETKATKQEKAETKATKQEKSEAKATKQEKNVSFFSRLGSRISRALSRSQSTDESIEQTKNTEQHTGSQKEDGPDQEREIEEIREEVIEEVNLSPSRDTFYAMPTGTKSGHDKVIMELAAIAQNAKLVAAKAEALKSARLQGESDSSGEESSGTNKTLSRRDSEKNIEQAAENLRTTLKNLSEAEQFEIEKPDGDKQETHKEVTKPATAMKKKMNVSVISEMEGFFAKSNKGNQKRKESGEKTPDTKSIDEEKKEICAVQEKDETSNGTVNDDSLDATKEKEEDEKKDDDMEDEPEKEKSKTDEPSEVKVTQENKKEDEGKKEDESKEEEERKKEETDKNVSQDTKQVKPEEDDDDKVKINGNLSDDDKTTD